MNKLENTSEKKQKKVEDTIKKSALQVEKRGKIHCRNMKKKGEDTTNLSETHGTIQEAKNQKI